MVSQLSRLWPPLWRALLILSVVTLSPVTFALTVAFLELHGRGGVPIAIEPDGRFVHVAMSARGGWVHAQPKGGVQWSPTLDGLGSRVVYLQHPHYPEPSDAFLERWLGKPFDHDYRWDNANAMYCSRFPALWIGVDPDPMNFLSSAWMNYSDPPCGEPGLGPNDLYSKLVALGFTPPPNHLCEVYVSEQAKRAFAN